MGKEKVLSVRLNEDQFNTLDSLSETMELKKSKFVRNLISKQLKASESGKEILDVKIKPAQYKTLTELAEKSNLKPDKYLRRLVKESLESPGGKSVISGGGGISEAKYKDLENDYNEMTSLYQEISTKYHQLENENKALQNTIETLSTIKNDFLEQLLFLMKFFQTNAQLLQKHDREFIMKNKEKFAMIAKQVEGIE